MASYASSLYAASFSTFLFGFYTSLGARCSLILWNRYKTRKKLHWYLLFTHIAFVLLVTTRCIVVLVRIIQPVLQGIFEPPEPWERSSVLVDALWMASVMVSDAFITYRSYIVWGKNVYIVIAPAVLVLGNFAVMVLSLMQMATAPNPPAPEKIAEYFAQFGASVKRFVIMTLVVNITNTVLISFRIWNVRRKTTNARVGNDSLSGLLSLLIESAAFYTAILIVHIVAISLNNFILIPVFTDLQTPIIGIVFSSIIISVAQGSAFSDTSATGAFHASGDRRVTWPARSRSNTTTNTGRGPTEILMQTVITTRRDADETQEDAKRSTNSIDKGS
ncbi:hypothetical protein GYMLUDRAFT_246341 [Collybiopsis luxurians FD-317 M1]|uniref:Uncharacterized protein n=1 Tax=Collybiopsis luxurians FD-317 M1 TaxID=944289 RepID=A0A0D0BSI9_9AGAR|nr:hypothetical protein GYMLUDRAFT_246341 [Collybiopsis luxurians FD-317 M1]